MSNTDFESLDYEEIEDAKPIKESNKPDDFLSIIVDKVYAFDWIMLLAVAISFIFIISDLYNEQILNKFKGAINESQDVTTYGYMIQLCSLLIGTIVSKMLFSIAGK